MKHGVSRVALGIDFGGTSVKAGWVDQAGRVLARYRTDTAALAGIEGWMDFVAACLSGAGSAGRRAAGIGVGVPGFVDFERGFIYNLTNVPGWTRVPLAGRMRKRFGLAVCVDNDVNAMAVGECAHGAGRGVRHALFATLGTGVGGALLIDGRLYRGAFSMAGEIGHLSINRRGRKTPEGRGGLETYVGIGPFTQRAARLLRRGRPSLLRRLAPPGVPLTPKLIAAAARRGDPLARELFDEFADCLATAFASVTYLLQPELIIVGGGVAQSGRVLFEPLRRRLRERLNPFFADRIRVAPAQLGADAGLIGAASLVFQSGSRPRALRAGGRAGG